MKILTFSSLYPNNVQPQHGIFVENRLRKLVATGEVDTTVVAPVPWFPFRSKHFGAYSQFASIADENERYGIQIKHPRYIVIPKIGMNIAPSLMYRGVASLVARVVSTTKTDLIDSHYFFPDGVAASRIAEALRLPFVVTARGTDINLVPKFRRARKMILEAAARASAIISVSEALKERMVEIGIEKSKIVVLRNGVDLDLFQPIEQSEARSKVGDWTGKWLLTVGHLIERKGHHLAVEMLSHLPGFNLAIVGTGPMRSTLGTLCEKFGVSDRVHFLGAVDQAALRYYYSAADALVLASSREGMANVLLESIACGLPVVATPLWGSPEVVADPSAGVLSRDRSVAALADAVRELFENYPDRAATREYARGFGWNSTTTGQISVFKEVLSRRIDGG